jgi:hypothetical protein
MWARRPSINNGIIPAKLAHIESVLQGDRKGAQTFCRIAMKSDRRLIEGVINAPFT